MDKKGFVFSTDVLIALIIVTMALGLTINQFDALNFQIQDFTGRQSLEKTTNDAADFLVKNTGTPKDWETSFPPLSNSLPGLAYVDRATNPSTATPNVFAVSNYLDSKKIFALDENPNLITNLVHTSNFYVAIKSLDGSWSPIVQGNLPPANAKEVAVANRTVTLIPGDVLLRLTDLAHLNPSSPGDNPFLWYWKQNQHGNGAKPAVYEGPKTGDWQAGNNTVYITQDDINNYDFYIRIDTNQGGGSGVSKAQYGFTDANWAVNGSYGNGYIGYDPRNPPSDTSDDNRWTAIDGELSYIRSVTGNGQGSGWTDINNQQLDTGDFIQVNDALNQTYNARGSPYFRLWFNVPSDVNADFSISLVRTFHGQSLKRVPANLILMVWEP